MDYMTVLEKDKPLAIKLHAHIIEKQITIQNLNYALTDEIAQMNMRDMKLINERIEEEREELQKAMGDYEDLQKEYVRLNFRFFPVEKVSSWR